MQKKRLETVLEMLTGEEDAVGYEEGILGSLSYIDDIISRHSPLYHSEDDFFESEFGRILEDKKMNNHKKARLLLGMK